METALAIILVLRFIYREGIQMCNLPAWTDYFQDPWNFLQMSSYLLTLVSLFVHSRDVFLLTIADEWDQGAKFAEDECQSLRELHAVAGGSLW